MNIYQKINEVMKKIEYLTKDDKVEFGTTKYKAISEEKVTTAVREQLVSQGIVIIPIEQQSANKELIRTEKSVFMLTSVHVKYRIQNIDDVSDYIEVESNGTGVDTQDKGVGKAMTYAYKYMLLRTFAIPTGEDPDKTSSAETDAKIENEIKNEQKRNQNQKSNIEDLNELVTEQQANTIRILMKQKGLNTEQQLWDNYSITDPKDLTRKQYASVLKVIQNLPNKEKVG